MSVQSNSGSGGGSLEATPSWSQLSSSPTISQQHITATAKSKEGILARQVPTLATLVLVKPHFLGRRERISVVELGVSLWSTERERGRDRKKWMSSSLMP